MKKLFTVIALAATAFAVNAQETATWSVQTLTGVANNDNLDGKTFVVNDNISFTLEHGEATETQYCKYRKTTADGIYLQIYSKNVVTFTATDATITAITFKPSTAETNTNTAWQLYYDNKTGSINAENPTWTGSATEITFTANKVGWYDSFEITYTPNKPVDPNAFKTANLFFTEDQIADKGTPEALTVTLENEGVSVVFTTTSTSAQLNKSTSYFGTADDYTAFNYSYQPGGKSTKGIESTQKGVMTFPCDGTLYIYALNNQDADRNLQIIQNNETIWEQHYSMDDYVEDGTKKVYPIYSTNVGKGTAYFLWPTNQLKLYGFKFVPNNNTAIGNVAVARAIDTQAYDMMGRPVSDSYRGIVIIGGKKYLRK